MRTNVKFAHTYKQYTFQLGDVKFFMTFLMYIFFIFFICFSLSVMELRNEKEVEHRDFPAYIKPQVGYSFLVTLAFIITR